jgi:hypothetical protein
MEIKQVPVDSLSADPANARKHPERNLETIIASLRRFGQQKPIVVDRNGIVRAGNGTLEAARRLGWDTVAVVETELNGVEATAYAIADNRTAELAEWDDDVLAATLNSLALEDGLLDAAGFDEDELESLLGDNVDGKPESQKSLPQSLQLKPEMEYCVILCSSDEEWLLMQEGFKLKQVRRGGYKHGSPFDAVGIERVIGFSDLMERLRDVDSSPI